MPAFPSTSTVMVPSTIAPFLGHTQHSTTLNIYYQNIRGVRTKVNELRLSSSESDYNIIILAETWLDENIPSSLLFGSEYTVTRGDRTVYNSSLSLGAEALSSQHLVI